MDFSDTTFTVELPECTFTLDTADVGPCALSYSKDTVFNVILENPSSFDILISDTYFTGLNSLDFKLTSLIKGMTIKPGKRISVEVNFAPSATGKRTARLHIVYNCGLSDTLNITGTGFCSGKTIELVDMGNQLVKFQKIHWLNASLKYE